LLKAGHAIGYGTVRLKGFLRIFLSINMELLQPYISCLNNLEAIVSPFTAFEYKKFEVFGGFRPVYGYRIMMMMFT
jgi:hypothetical protein